MRTYQDLSTKLVRTLALATLLSSTWGPVARADWSAAQEEQALWSARACYLEASFREADCIALLWVVKKRALHAEQSWMRMLRAYTAIDANNQRAREVRDYPWGDIPGKPGKFNQRWLDLRELAAEITSGLLPDPCPRARHWGGTMDRPQGRMVPARCAVSTANTFYALKR